MDDEERTRFGEANHREVDSFLSNEMCEMCKHALISTERAMKMRWALTYTAAQVGELGRTGPNTRLVILGYHAPDVDELERESPTASTTSHSLIRMADTHEHGR